MERVSQPSASTTEPEPQAQSDAPDLHNPVVQAEPEPEGEHPSREAASYRRRLRETEAERDALRERVESYERREAEAIARDLGAAVPIDDLRGDDGALDPETVQARVSAILAERPTWRRSAPDLGAGPRPPVDSERKPGLSALLGKR